MVIVSCTQCVLQIHRTVWDANIQEKMEGECVKFLSRVDDHDLRVPLLGDTEQQCYNFECVTEF